MIIIFVLLITGRGIPWGAADTITRRRWRMIEVATFVLLLILPAVKGGQRLFVQWEWNQILCKSPSYLNIK